jgi:D-erythro-7,8-dihydroneopterin triphosphate epimerase
MKGWLAIEELRLRCKLGISPRERRRPQPILVALAVYCDIEAAVRKDGIDATIDYRTIEREFYRLSTERSYCLLETLAAHLLEWLWSDHRVLKVRLAVRKPRALRRARWTAVELERERPSNN